MFQNKKANDSKVRFSNWLDKVTGSYPSLRNGLLEAPAREYWFKMLGGYSIDVLEWSLDSFVMGTKPPQGVHSFISLIRDSEKKASFVDHTPKLPEYNKKFEEFLDAVGVDIWVQKLKDIGLTPSSFSVILEKSSKGRAMLAAYKELKQKEELVIAPIVKDRYFEYNF